MSSLLTPLDGLALKDAVPAVASVLNKVMSQAGGEREISVRTADEMLATLKDASQYIKEWEEMEGLSTSDARLVRSVSRKQGSFKQWEEKLIAKRSAALDREDVQKEINEIELQLQVAPAYTDDDRREEFALLADRTRQLSDLQSIITEKVEEQQEVLDQANRQMDQVVDDTNAGLKQLQGGVKQSYGSVGTTFGLVGAAIVGGAAALGGVAAAPALGIAAIGGLSARYAGKKIAKRAVKNATAGVDEHIESAPT